MITNYILDASKEVSRLSEEITELERNDVPHGDDDEVYFRKLRTKREGREMLYEQIRDLGEMLRTL